MQNPQEQELPPVNKGFLFMEAGELTKAEDQFRQCMDNPDAVGQLATIAYRNGHFDEAERLLNKAIEMAPDRIDFRLGVSTLLKSQGKDEEALNIIKTLHDNHKKDDELKMALAGALLVDCQYEDALVLLEDLVKRQSENVQVLSNLAIAYRETGRVKQSEATSLKVIRLNRDSADAYVNLIATATYERGMFDLNHVEKMAERVSYPAFTTSLLNNVLGTCYEHLGEYEKSFHFYAKANERIRQEFPEDANKHLREQVVGVKRAFTKEKMSIVQSDAETPMVFIFGMPRSGSTLIEQILIGHHDIETAGETMGVQETIDQYIARLMSDPYCEAFDISPESLGAEYLKERHGEVNSRFLIDKMPPNYQYLGMMYMMFPNAKFIFTTRDPMDTCFSAWSIVFSQGNGYTYSFEELAENYKICHDMMEHWKSVLPEGTIHTVKYEDVIQNHEDTIQALCDYMGIEYTLPMRQFHKTRRRVHTASVGQVNKPLYSTSVGRAVRFGELLAPLREALND